MPPGPHSASLHAEDRAIDWHPSDHAAARKLIDELLAPDKAGDQPALARRMGVEELIWNCRYWGAGMETWKPYSVCFDSHGKRKHTATEPVADEIGCRDVTLGMGNRP